MVIPPRARTGAIQVLALVSRRGREIDGETAELARILVLSPSDGRDDVLEAVKAGCHRISVEKCVEGGTWRGRTSHSGGPRRVHAGTGRPGAGRVPRIAQTPAAGSVIPSLTERETEVLRYIAKGLTAKQIAARLSLSHRTVEKPCAGDVS